MLAIGTEEKLDPRVKRTRQMLEQAFMEAVQEKGFQSVSVQDIAERAGVNRATFYAHFEDKYALLDHSIRQGFRQELEKRFEPKMLSENIQAFLATVVRLKPATAKGTYIKSINLSSTMGPGVSIDRGQVAAH